MSGKASNSKQSSVSLSGSGAMSHVYIQFPPLRCCNIPGSKGLFYDEGNKLLLCPTSDQVFSWKTVPFDPLVAPTSDTISEGPILSIQFSLDMKLIAIQRSIHEIQFWHRETGEAFSQRCKTESESILGFFWTDCPFCNIVFIKTSGLDMFSYDSRSKSLQLVEIRKMIVSWYVYTHESRLVLLASGMQCKTFKGFQLSSAGIIRLPKFEMTMAKPEANNKPVLAAEDIYIVTVYGRIYCLQVDRVAMLLHLYRFYRDAVVQQGGLPIYSSRISVSVVDNILLVHQVDAKVVILYDIFADSRAPISAPLPLLVRGIPRSNSFAAWSSSNENLDADAISEHEAVIYGDSWNFIVPDLICDIANNLLWKIHLDLEAISASSSEVPCILEFLQRRKLNAKKAKQLSLAIARNVILERRPVVMVSRVIDVLVSSYSHANKSGNLKGPKSEKTIIPPGVATRRVDVLGKSTKESLAAVDRESQHRTAALLTSDTDNNFDFERPSTISKEVKIVGNTVDREKSSSFQYNLLGPGSSNQLNDEESQLSSPAVSPDEMYSFVFAPVEEEIIGDLSYLVAVIIEFIHRATLEKIKVHPNIYVLTIQLLARNDRYMEIGLFVLNKILEPSEEVALQLLESGHQSFQMRKLGLDMLSQLSLHHDYVSLLVQDGYYLEALRYARKYKVENVRPSLFLDAAFASNDSQHLAAVLRFFSDFQPGFKFTSDHNRYYHILNEMNSSTAA